MKKHFKDTLKYNEWANYRIYKTIEENCPQDEELLKLFGHILFVQTIWLNWMKGFRIYNFPVWEVHKIDELSKMLEESSTHWYEFVLTHPSETFEEMIFYTRPDGQKCENTAREIITHMLNHGTHHRGQIAKKLREKGHEPPKLDYILYTRAK